MVVLETKRLILRGPELSDADDLADGLNDLETSKYLSVVKYPYSKKDAEGFIKLCREDAQKKPRTKFHFFLELKSEHKLIGNIDLTVENEIGKTGSWVHRNYRRQGFMTEAKIAINNYYFNELNGRKMETEAYSDNEASCKVQEKMGYVREGLRRKSLRSSADNKIHDLVLYGMLKNEWMTCEKELTKELEEKF